MLKQRRTASKNLWTEVLGKAYAGEGTTLFRWHRHMLNGTFGGFSLNPPIYELHGADCKFIGINLERFAVIKLDQRQPAAVHSSRN